MNADLEKYLKQAQELAKKLDKDADWTITDILTNPNIAAEAMYLLTQSEEYAPWVIGAKDKAKVKKGLTEPKPVIDSETGEPKVDENGNVVTRRAHVRTDVSTIKKMYQMRNTVKKYAATEDNDEYVDFWKEILDVQNTYFIKAAMDAYEVDESVIDHINELRKSR